ncbi:MAG: PHP domain-containing protein [Elusimicrobia bacterium]|nr:PHP domain-containing protein [Elusimicrobiota bacterium]
MPLINLHAHSTFSDGTLSPAELARAASKARIAFFSLTDHDISLGWDELETCLKKLAINYIYGIELSTGLHDNLHILGYGLDLKDPGFLEKLAQFRSKRIERIKKIIALLKEQGLNLSFEELNIVIDHAYGRPHVADLLRNRGFVKTRQKAFEKYISCGKPAYVPPCGPGMEEAIKTIKAAGGIAVLAHPGVIYNIMDLGGWKEMGLDGIEAFYPSHSNALTREFLELAEKYDLVVTAGTDFHGPGSGREEMAGFEYQEEFFAPIRKRFL